MAADLDLAVLAHLRGFPDELQRFGNLLKQRHAEGGSAVEFILSRPAATDSFLVALCRAARDGQDVVTVVEAAEILGTSPAALLGPPWEAALPAPIAGEGRHRLWRRPEIEARRPGPGPGSAG